MGWVSTPVEWGNFHLAVGPSKIPIVHVGKDASMCPGTYEVCK